MGCRRHGVGILHPPIPAISCTKPSWIANEPSCVGGSAIGILVVRQQAALAEKTAPRRTDRDQGKTGAAASPRSGAARLHQTRNAEDASWPDLERLRFVGTGKKASA